MIRWHKHVVDIHWGYVTIAKQIGIAEDEFNAGDYLKRQSAVDIIYKSLFTPFLIQDNTDSSNAESANYVIADGSGDIELKTLYKLYFE